MRIATNKGELRIAASARRLTLGGSFHKAVRLRMFGKQDSKLAPDTCIAYVFWCVSGNLVFRR